MYCSSSAAAYFGAFAVEAVARVIQQSRCLSPAEVALFNSRLRQASHSAREFASRVIRLIGVIAIELNPHPVVPEILDLTPTPSEGASSCCVSVSSEDPAQAPVEEEDVLGEGLCLPKRLI